MIKYLLFVVVLSTLNADEAFDYTGYHLIRITPKNIEHLNILGEWQHEQDVCLSPF